ncbi:DUF5320 domain-containing protein [Methanosarcina sp. WH1]|uniref:DUF5320 domain-containing protein n=1 Tax=Methanosarcina sp. WH1 TaxID=1434102 RepID=UPI00064F40E8|nr:DUF5320 domain-containing protein [Methanosarcina sp. WH1]
MPNGNRTGPTGNGSKTGRNLGYCTGNDSPGYTKGVPSGAGRRFGGQKSGGRKSGSGSGRGMGCAGKGRGYRCRSAPEVVNARESAVLDTYPEYYYAAPSQSQAVYEADLLENRINLLKQELKSLSWKFKALLPGKQ